ncbi:MAG: hypothetical protein GY730_07540 [bacterium]|nr:hypothetical protein [bacterium]
MILNYTVLIITAINLMCSFCYAEDAILTATKNNQYSIRDPFEPAEYSKWKSYSKNVPSLNYLDGTFVRIKIKLDGIIWDKVKPYAIFTIRGIKQSVEEGQELYGVSIEKVAPQYVLLKMGSKEIIIKIGQEYSL